jgi:hypothetical protein
MLDKIWKFCRRSLTIAWSYALAMAGALLAVLPYAADIVASPDVASAVHDALPAHWVGLYTVGIAVVTYAVRMRTAAK